MLKRHQIDIKTDVTKKKGEKKMNMQIKLTSKTWHDVDLM